MTAKRITAQEVVDKLTSRRDGIISQIDNLEKNGFTGEEKSVEKLDKLIKEKNVLAVRMLMESTFNARLKIVPELLEKRRRGIKYFHRNLVFTKYGEKATEYTDQIRELEKTISEKKYKRDILELKKKLEYYSETSTLMLDKYTEYENKFFNKPCETCGKKKRKAEAPPLPSFGPIFT